MARPDRWLSAEIIHALGLALIHSLWQCVALAAAAAALMAFIRRPPVRYIVATFTLTAMLAVPAATFFIFLKQNQPITLPAAGSKMHWAVSSSVSPLGDIPVSLAAPPTVVPHGEVGILGQSHKVHARHFLESDFPAALLPWLVGTWLCGVGFFSLRFLGGVFFLEYRRRSPSSVPGLRILALARALQSQLGIERAIQYLECDWLRTPAVIGWLRPVILLPVSALTGLDEIQLKAVIAHELAHVRRLDPLVNLLQMMIETLLFYHPAVWWLNKRIRSEREFCCDEIAISLTGHRVEYAKVLALMAEWEKAPALAMAANRGPLSERIFHILGRKRLGAGQRAVGLFVSILFLIAAIGAAHAVFEIGDSISTADKTSLKPVANQGALIKAARRAPASLSPDRNDVRWKMADSGQAERAEGHRKKTLMAHSGTARLMAPHPDLQRLLQRLVMPQLTEVSDPPAAPEGPAAHSALATWALLPKAQPRTCALPAVMDSVDLENVAGTDLRTVPVAINGAQKQFLLALGTNPSEVSQAAASALHLPSATMGSGGGGGLYADIDASGVPIFDVHGGRSAEDYRPHVRAASFTIGDATGHDLFFLVAKDPEMGKSKPYDGLMTGGFFKEDDVELDFAQNKLRYLTPTSCTDPDQVAYWPHAAVAAIPMTSSDGKIQIEVSIQGHPIPAVVDTTSPRTVMRRDIAELVFGLKADTPEMAPEGDLRDGTGLTVYQHTFPLISFAGNVMAYNVPALIQANSMVHDLNRTPILGSRAQFMTDPRQRIPALTLGMDVLHQLHVYVVPGEQTLYVTSSGRDLGEASAINASPGAVL
jgi:beta-lactamase regulating signal transducer with metallopeptidase domain